MMRTYICIAACLLAAGTGVLAQRTSITRVLPPKQGVTFAERWRPPTGGGDTKILGNVIDIRMVPVAHVKVQLRNLANGTIEQTSESNDNGDYDFTVDNSGTYVVEMVMVDGYILALSNAGSLARYDTLRTVIQLPGRWDSQMRSMSMPVNATNFMGMTSLATMTATTMTLAADQNIAPVSSGEPVSPTSPTRQ